MPRTAFIIVLVLTTGSTFGQADELAEPRVTAQLANRIEAGIGRMAEAEAVRLLPAAYRLEPGKPKAEWKITCAETTEIVAEFVDGKLTSRSARFDPSVKSQRLTPEQFRLLKDGMSVLEVTTLLRGQNRKAIAAGKDDQGRQVESWRWVHGRELWITVTDGMVTGCGHVAYTEN